MYSVLDKTALALLIAGALNWGSVGLFSFNAVEFLLGSLSYLLVRGVYALIGACGLWCITFYMRDAKTGK